MSLLMQYRTVSRFRPSRLRLPIMTATAPQFCLQNLIQAQRDYFGAHTYKRIDKEGVFHTEWLD